MRYLLIGLGVTNRAVDEALRSRGHETVVIDDADTNGVPDTERYERALRDVDVVIPSPGVGDVHPALALAHDTGVAVRSEFDLAAEWDDRPWLAITGTDGKTTVTTLTTAMLQASGMRATAAGNNDLPLVAAIDDPAVDVFVVEASSFRIDHSERFAPAVATWLNFSPDHLNLHRSLASYEAAKAKIWRDQSAEDVAVGSADDETVLRHLRVAPARQLTFGLRTNADFRVDGGRLLTDDGRVLAEVGELRRAFPHDLANGLASAATALSGGATLDGCHDALTRFDGLPHRIALVAEVDGVRWYDDSKATTPNATLAAMQAFDSVVLIAGGQNKGLDLRVLAQAAGRVRAVVAIGDAAAEVESAFAGVRPVVVAESMPDAVALARRLAKPGDAVLLSPACASFDWYRSYGERGDDFCRQVRGLTGATA